jgi:hypothetical protein
MKRLSLVVAMSIAGMLSGAANAAVIDSSPIPSNVIVVGNNGLEFVYGSVTSPDDPCCGIEVTLTQGFRLPTVAEVVGGFTNLTSLLTAFNLLDDEDANNIVAFQYFNNLDVSPFGDVGDVRAGFINNLDFGSAFYDYSGSQFRTDHNADFFFVRSQIQGVPEPATLGLMGLGIAGLLLSRKKKAV